MSGKLDGTRAFITGGGSGIGRASALALADETVRLVKAAGGDGAAVLCDVADEESVAHAAEAAAGPGGRLDFGVNSAGVSGGDDLEPLAGYATSQFDRMIAIDLRGTFLSMKYELRYMTPFRRGSIVNIASGAGLVGVPGFAGYAAANHGQIGLTKASSAPSPGNSPRLFPQPSKLISNKDHPCIKRYGADPSAWQRRSARCRLG